jgi:hypothetical protein
MAELARLLEKTISLNGDESTLRGWFFNPMFAVLIPDLLPKAAEDGFRFKTDESLAARGERIKAEVISPDGSTMDLGSVVVHEDGTIEPERLVRVTKLIGFVEENEVEE